MAKQKRTAFGISEDGLSIKLAYLIRDGHQISLQALEQVELNQSLYQHPAAGAAEAEVKTDSWSADSGTSGELNFDELSDDNLGAIKSQPYESMFQTYSLDQGILALNTFDEQIIKLPINRADISQKQKNKLVKENILPSEYKAGQWQSSVVTINDQAELWIQHGNQRLLEILEDSQKNQRTKFFFQLSDANEIALANLFITNQPADSTETSMILYLGNDYRRALIFEGNKWTFSLPIQLTQPRPEIDVIYSKLSLAMDEAHIKDPDNLYVCGDSCFLESVEYLRSQLPNTTVELWHLDNLYMDSEAAQVYDIDMVARFMLSIALAWKALTLDNPSTLKSNFLPSYVIEGQKVFKIAWHGYLIFVLLFFSALYISIMTQQLKYDIEQQTQLNKLLTKEYTEKKQQAETMLAMAKAIEQQAAVIEVIKTLLNGQNPWTEIITRLNNSFQSHPTSWIKNLRREGNGFKVIGVTTYRPNIVYFSNLFPNGSIMKASYRKIHNFTVWDFEINYSYPEVDWYKMMEADAEQLRLYRESKTDTTLKKVMPGTPVVEDKKQTVTTVKTDQNKKTSTTTSNKVVVRSTSIDIPYPPKDLLANTNDPMVKSYNDIVKAFNAKSDWQMVDLGVKFINNYPKNILRSYVRWYLAYRGWQNKQYDKALLWLEPLMKTRDSLYPYSLLLSSVIYRDYNNPVSSKELLNEIVRDYPQHPVAKTARAMLAN